MPPMPDTAVHEYRFGGATRLLALVLAFGPTVAAPWLLGEREVRVTCTRDGTGPHTRAREGLCAIEHARVLSVARQEVPLASVLGVRLDVAQSGRAGRSGLSLVTVGAAVVVADDLREDAAAKMARELNAFLVDPAPHAVDARAPRGPGLGTFYAALAAALALLGAFAYRSAPQVHVELDPATDAVIVVRRLWPFRAHRRSTARDVIVGVVVEGIPAGAPDRFRVTLVKKDGEREPLTIAYHAGGRAPHDALAFAVLDFVRGSRPGA